MSDLTEIIISGESRADQLKHLDAVSGLYSAVNNKDLTALLHSLEKETYTEKECTEALVLAAKANNIEAIPYLYTAGGKVKVNADEIKLIYGVDIPDQPQAYIDKFREIAVANNYTKLKEYILMITQRRLHEDATIALLHEVACNNALYGKKAIVKLGSKRK